MLTITEDNFELEVSNSDIPVLVDFWADWCVPCRMIAPIINTIESRYEGKIKFCKVNIDDEGSLALTYRVMSIPVLMVFRGGKVLGRLVGAHPESVITEFLDGFIG